MPKYLHKIFIFIIISAWVFSGYPQIFNFPPEIKVAAAASTFRTTTYELEGTEFSGTTYTLTLNNNLAANYFAMIAGANSQTASRGPDDDGVRVTDDPFGTGSFPGLVSANQIELTRSSSVNNWIGSVTIVECLGDCTTSGFELREVREVVFSDGTANTLQTVTDTLAQAHTSQTVPFGGFFGGGMQTTGTGLSNNEYAVTLGVRIYKSGANQITLERYGAQSRIPRAGTITVYIVEWGSGWTVQNVNVTGTNSGNGINATGEYNTASITSVTRANTWVWAAGHARDDGIGDGAFGQVATLGDGVSQNINETSVAVGAEGGQISPGRDFQVYVMSHPSLAVDYRFKADGNTGSSSGYQELTFAVDSANGSETYDNTSGTVRYTEGYRIPIIYTSSAGGGQAYSRPVWSPRINADTTLLYWRAYAGQPFAAWAQIADFANITFTADDVTVSTSGTQTASLDIPSTNQYVGGTFAITENTSSRNVTGITITENGTVNASTNLDNIKLQYDLDTTAPYDCASESWASGDSQFGATDTDGFSAANGTSAFTGTAAISTTQTMCVYAVLDVLSGAANNETVEIEISNPSTEVTVSAGAVGPGTAVALSGTTNLSTNISPNTTQSFQDGVSPTGSYAGTRDTYIHDNLPTTNNGSATEILVDGSALEQYGTLLKWDITDIPAGQIVQSAVITLTSFNATSDTYSVYEMLRNWVESEATWEIYATGSSWQTNGGTGALDSGTTVFGTITGGTGERTITLNASGVALVQGWVNNPSSNYGFFIENYLATDGADFRSREYATASSRPKLTVTYGSSSIVESRVSQSSDDAEEQNPPSGSMYLTSSDLELISDGSTDQEVGMRFQNIVVPQGAIITNAYVQFTVDELDSGTTNLTIYGEDIDVAPTFTTTAGNITNRTKTSASVAWNSVPAWTTVGDAGTDQRTPDITSIIQEIVNRVGWASGNSLVVIIDGTGERTAESYDGVPTSAPLLRIEYADIPDDVTVSTSGTQTASLDIPSTNQYVGGTFAITENTSSRNVTGITITENGTVNASTNLDNIKLQYDLDTTAPYDCASESWASGDSQFGATDTDGFSAANGTSAFTGTAAISTTQTMCVYAVLDVLSGAANNETVEIEISNPSTEVTVSAGAVGPGTAVALSGTTNLSTNISPNTTQSFQDGVSPTGSYAGTRDTYIHDNLPTTNNGSATEILVDGSALEQYGTLLKWDITDIPAGQIVQSAVITLTSFNATSDTYSVYEMLRNWVESEATWEIYATGSSWQTNGGTGALDSGTTVFGTITGGTGERTITLNASGVALVQGWVNNPSSNYGFFIENYLATDGADFRSREYATASSRPKLTVTYGSSSIVESRVSQSSDDAEEQNPPSGSMYLTSSDLELISDGSTDQEVGMRFQNIVVPQGAIITNAYVQFTVDELDSGTTNLTIYGEDIDVAPTFTTTAGNITNRTKTSASVAWNSVPAWTTVGDAGTDQRTPDITSIIQEIVNRVGWASGNSLVVIIDGTGERTAESYDGVPTSAPLLRIEYINPGLTQIHYRWRNDDGNEASATWAALEDTASATINNTLVRLRFEVSNEGSANSTSTAYRLEVSGPDPSSCAAASYVRVDSSSDWDMATSTYFADGDPTTNVSGGLTDENTTFLAGEMKEANDITSGIVLTTTEFIEIEYAFKSTPSATSGALYCFRLTNAGTAIDIYSAYARTTLGGYKAVGTLVSVVLDTGVSDGAAYNSILWKGIMPAGTKVRLQLATSNSSSGPWSYISGPTCSSGDYYEPLPDQPDEIGCFTSHNNKRYFKYRVELCSSTDCITPGGNTPIVQDVVVSWSP
ncbi:MAG: hypothetical protein BMS9Abin13_110 [Patescibacteria group bacterium]|nr:MAG: hypothetical protein BMS9Abin13_110 [Patescibacteria group bacterium]